MGKVITFLYHLLGNITTLTFLPLTVCALSAVAAFEFGSAMLGRLLLLLGGIAPAGVAFGGQSVAFHVVGFMDNVLPLHEGLALVVAYMGLLAVCAVIRITKSFIPTLSS